MQSTAGSVLRPRAWRGLAGRKVLKDLHQKLPCFTQSGFLKFAPLKVRTTVSLQPQMTAAAPAVSSTGRRKEGSWLTEAAAGKLAAGKWAEKVEQRRGVRTKASRGLLEAINEVKNPVAEKDIEFESPLDIVLYPDPRLRAKNATVKKFDSKLEELCKEMFDVMYRTDGVGLSAPQVGVNFRVMVYNPEGVRGEGVEYVLVNPKIVSRSKKEDVFAEGCLSFPKMEADVVRPLDVKVQAQNLQGKRFSLTLKGWKARIFQHEYDHLEGILWHDRMTKDVREEILDELLALEKDYADKTGQDPPETVRKLLS